MKYQVFFISFILLLSSQTKAQNASATINTLQSCDMTEVIVSVNVQNFYDVGALSIFIIFDTMTATYVSVENTHPAFTGLLYNFMTSPLPQIGFSWSGINGVNVTAGKFCDIRFLFKTGQTELAFAPWCEIVTSDLEEIPINYTNGSVSSLIIITQQPQDCVVNHGNAAQFNVVANGADSFQWQWSSDGGNTFDDMVASEFFTGVNTQELTILSTDTGMDGTALRCKLTKDDCQVFSEIAFLEVITAPIQQAIYLNEGWNGLSFTINPGFDTIQNLLDLIQADVKYLSDGTSIYFPAGNLNTFQGIDPKKAFLIKIDECSIVEISGMMHENKEIIIPQGWSLMPVLSLEDQEIEALFENHAENLEIIKDVAGSGVFWPKFGINTIQYLRSGEAYYIKTKNGFTLNF